MDLDELNKEVDRRIIESHARVIDPLVLTLDVRLRLAVNTINRLAENAGWDDAVLVAELEALTLDGFAIGLVGFSDSDIDRLLRRSRGREDEDNVPPTPERAVTVDGDVWLLSAHRLACGDSTRAEVAAALAGARPALMVTDPPYGVDYDADWRNRAIMIEGERRGAHGSRSTGKVLNDTRADWREARGRSRAGASWLDRTCAMPASGTSTTS